MAKSGRGSNGGRTNRPLLRPRHEKPAITSPLVIERKWLKVLLASRKHLLGHHRHPWDLPSFFLLLSPSFSALLSSSFFSSFVSFRLSLYTLSPGYTILLFNLLPSPSCQHNPHPYAAPWRTLRSAAVYVKSERNWNHAIRLLSKYVEIKLGILIKCLSDIHNLYSSEF